MDARGLPEIRGRYQRSGEGPRLGSPVSLLERAGDGGPLLPEPDGKWGQQRGVRF
jgi:hypothetical protein